jgi:hypothetical protein
MPNDPEVAARLRAGNEFALARAKALNTYADLERTLAALFSTLTKTDTRRGYLIFAAIGNYRTRRETLSDLMTIGYGDKYSEFFDCFIERLQRVDEIRNRIVHWIVMTSHRGGEPFKSGRDVFLAESPDIFARGKLVKSDIVEFDKKADFLRLLIFYFDVYLKFGEKADAPGNDPSKTPWSEIFRNRISYPPPPDHPLFPAR